MPLLAPFPINPNAQQLPSLQKTDQTAPTASYAPHSFRLYHRHTTKVQHQHDELSGLAGLVVRTGFRFKGSELDLIVADPASRHIVVAEAKGPLPPHGSRGTARVAERVGEGMRQLDRFRALPADHRELIIERAIGFRLADPTFDYVLLCRSCMGSPDAWDEAAPAVPATLPLLRMAVKRMIALPLGAAPLLVAEIKAATADVIRRADPHWAFAVVELFGTRLELPLLDYDRDAVDLMMRETAR